MGSEKTKVIVETLGGTAPWLSFPNRTSVIVGRRRSKSALKVSKRKSIIPEYE